MRDRNPLLKRRKWIQSPFFFNLRCDSFTGPFRKKRLSYLLNYHFLSNRVEGALLLRTLTWWQVQTVCVCAQRPGSVQVTCNSRLSRGHHLSLSRSRKLLPYGAPDAVRRARCDSKYRYAIFRGNVYSTRMTVPTIVLCLENSRLSSRMKCMRHGST
jgi:hypothetical protein